MIYLNGGFSAIESPFQDGGGATIDRSAVNIMIEELEAKTRELEKARQALQQNQQLAADKRSAELDRVAGELVETRSKLEFMERRARLNRQEAGPLTPADLQKELEEEIRQKNLVKTQIEQLRSELAASQENLRRNDQTIASLRQQNSSLQDQHSEVLKELATRSNSLENVRNKLNDATGEVARLNERLNTREVELSERNTVIDKTRKALKQAESSVTDYRQRLGNAESDIAFLRGRSAAMEKELASTRDRLLASEKTVKSREIELASAQTRLENMQTVLKNAVSDITNFKAELANENSLRTDAQNKLAKLQGDYNAVSSKLQTAEEKLRSDVLVRYSQAALKLRINLREKRLLMDRNEENNLYLPLININGRNFMVSTLRSFGGLRQNSSALSDVIELQYLASAPDGNAQGPVRKINGPLLVNKADCRIALLEIPSPAQQGLNVLTKNELKKRGIQDLYLFKSKSFGKDMTILDSRCAMSFESDDDYLYIRNGVRSSSELKAEVGDLVLTKQGELVAVVVALEDYDIGRQQEARCFVFTSLPEVDKLPQISLTKSAGQRDYRDFSDKLNFWLEQAKPLDAKKRRR